MLADLPDDLVDDLRVQTFAPLWIARVEMDRAGAGSNACRCVPRQLLERHRHRVVRSLRQVAVQGCLEQHPVMLQAAGTANDA